MFGTMSHLVGCRLFPGHRSSAGSFRGVKSERVRTGSQSPDGPEMSGWCISREVALETVQSLQQRQLGGETIRSVSVLYAFVTIGDFLF